MTRERLHPPKRNGSNGGRLRLDLDDSPPLFAVGAASRTTDATAAVRAVSTAYEGAERRVALAEARLNVERAEAAAQVRLLALRAGAQARTLMKIAGGAPTSSAVRSAAILCVEIAVAAVARAEALSPSKSRRDEIGRACEALAATFNVKEISR